MQMLLTEELRPPFHFSNFESCVQALNQWTQYSSNFLLYWLFLCPFPILILVSFFWISWMQRRRNKYWILVEDKEKKVPLPWCSVTLGTFALSLGNYSQPWEGVFWWIKRMSFGVWESLEFALSLPGWLDLSMFLIPSDSISSWIKWEY